MKPRQRDLLSAEAKFLSDYSGEDALHRWRKKLSDDERERLARGLNPLEEAYSQLVEVLGRMLRVLSEGLAKILRSLSGAFASAWANIFGSNTQLFGREAC